MRVFFNISFLGSRNPARLINKKAKNYGNDKEIFYYKSENPTVRTHHFYFSGPNILDFGTALSIKKITKKAEKVLGEEIEKEIKQEDVTVFVNIKGHSRGAVIASNIWNILKNKYPKNEKVKLNSLAKADEYAGPVNNSFEKNDVRTYDEPENVICTYSLKSRRPFKTPTKNTGASIVIFTDADHNSTHVIGNAAYSQFKRQKLGKGVYFFKKNDSLPCFSRSAKGDILKKQQEDIHQFKETAKFDKICDGNREEIFKKYAPNADKGRRTDLFFWILFGEMGKIYGLTPLELDKIPEDILKIYIKKQSRNYLKKILTYRWLTARTKNQIK
jgi:hypothetical protein